MKKRIAKIICAVMCIAVLLMPVSVFAAEEKSTLTLTYSKEGVIFSDVEIRIYRIAGEDLEKLPAYSAYPIEIGDLVTQAQRKEAASTFDAYITADGAAPDAMQITTAEGNVTFTDLEAGLYLVSGVTIEKDDSIYSFSPFLITLPSYDEEGNRVYNVSAKPKPAVTTKEEGEKTYTVLKLWRDDSSDDRPDEILVDILKNGILSETVTLKSENDWSYSFTSDDRDCYWTVVERNVPEGYTVTVSEMGTTFVIVNTYPGEGNDVPTEGPEGDSNAPQTGETLPVKLFVLIFCISGMMVLVFGIGVRRKANEKNR